jgi:hypothetical protein
MNWLDHLAQLVILVPSAVAVWAVARTDKWHRRGFLFGLASEPGFLYASVTTGQWGVLLLTAWWTWYWGVGAYRRYMKDVV